MRGRTTRRVAFAVLFSAAVALAQRPGGVGGGPGAGGPEGQRGPGRNRTDFLATVLGLTDAQKTQATAIFEAARTASASLREKLAQQRAALREAATSNAAEIDIDRLASALGDTSGLLAAIHTKSFGKFYALLTPEQQEKLKKLHANRGAMRGPGAELFVEPGL